MEIKDILFTGERPLFQLRDAEIYGCVFDDGESPLKEAENVRLYESVFKWKYPLWYARDIKAFDCSWYETARAGIWYTDDITVERAMIQAPKSFRRCKGVTLKDVTFSHAEETLWDCHDIRMENVFAKGDYFAMNCSDITVSGLKLDGRYSFDGVSNVTVSNSRLLTKDAFWNSRNVTITDSFLSSEYLGWNSENLTLINCTVESLQGLCYIKNLKMINCRLINTNLAFEYSTVDAEIVSGIASVFNPSGGTIRAPYIGELIMEPDRINPEKTRIICENIGVRKEKPDWRKD